MYYDRKISTIAVINALFNDEPYSVEYVFTCKIEGNPKQRNDEYYEIRFWMNVINSDSYWLQRNASRYGVFMSAFGGSNCMQLEM